MRQVARAAQVLAGVLILVASAAPPASADGVDDTPAGEVTGKSASDGGELNVETRAPGGEARPQEEALPRVEALPKGKGTSAKNKAPTVRDCSDRSIALSGIARGLEGWLGNAIDVTTEAPVAWRDCTRIADGADVGWVTGLPTVAEAPPVAAAAPAVPAMPTTDQVLASARSQLQLDLPDIATSPPRGGVQLVGIPVWFWIIDDEPVTTTATIPGLSATLTATPKTTHIAISGGTGDAAVDNVTIECPGGGTPWEPGRYDDRASSDCSHPFDWNGTFTIDATVEWDLAWTASNGQAGTLPGVPRTTTFTLTIQQGQAVTD